MGRAVDTIVDDDHAHGCRSCFLSGVVSCLAEPRPQEARMNRAADRTAVAVDSARAVAHAVHLRGTCLVRAIVRVLNGAAAAADAGCAVEAARSGPVLRRRLGTRVATCCLSVGQLRDYTYRPTQSAPSCPSEQPQSGEARPDRTDSAADDGQRRTTPLDAAVHSVHPSIAVSTLFVVLLQPCPFPFPLPRVAAGSANSPVSCHSLSPRRPPPRLKERLHRTPQLRCRAHDGVGRQGGTPLLSRTARATRPLAASNWRFQCRRQKNYNRKHWRN
jgi:hypothetical protein